MFSWFSRPVRLRTSLLAVQSYLPLIETEVLRGTDMKAIFKAILTTTAFALTLGVGAASLSTVAHAYVLVG
jgi:hypothetical protein